MKINLTQDRNTAYLIEVGESKCNSMSKYGKSDMPVADAVKLDW